MIDRRTDLIRRIQDIAVEHDRRESAFGRRETDLLNAIFAIREHVVICEVAVDGLRLLDILNDDRSEFVQCHQVEIYSNSGQQLATQPKCVIPKRHIQLALVMGESRQAPKQRFSKRIAKKPRDAFALIDRFQIEGTVFLDRDGRPQDFLQNAESQFIAIDGPVVANVCGHPEAANALVAFVRTSQISLFQIEEGSTRETMYFSVCRT